MPRLDFYFRRGGLGLFALLLGAVAWSAPTVVDLHPTSANVGAITYRANGFQSAITPLLPDDSYIAPLKPQLYRGSFGSASWNNTGIFYSYDANGVYRQRGAYDRLKQYGAQFQINSIADWNYEHYNQQPYENWAGWESMFTAKVTWTYNHTNSLGQHDLRDVQWDIWNEPNFYGVFWAGTLEQYREAWLRAFKAIRTVDPNAIIVGPSVAGYDKPYLQDFLTWAKNTKWDAAQTKNVVPTLLSYHDWDAAALATHMAEVKQFLADNGILGTGINQCRGVALNEYHYYKYNTTMNPSVLVTNMAKMEEAAHDLCDSNFTTVLGNRTCAEDPNPSEGDSCTNSSLNSTLVASTGEKRNIWWVHKAYAEMTGTLQRVTPEATTDNPMQGLASLDRTQHCARILLGKLGGTTGEVQVNVVNIPAELIKNGKTYVIADSIPYVPASTAPLAEPIRLMFRELPVTGGALTIRLPDFTASGVVTLFLCDDVTPWFGPLAAQPQWSHYR